MLYRCLLFYNNDTLLSSNLGNSFGATGAVIDGPLRWRCPWCWTPTTWLPSSLSKVRFRLLLVAFPFSWADTNKSFSCAFVEWHNNTDNCAVLRRRRTKVWVFDRQLDWRWMTTRPAWKTLFTANWNIFVRKSKRPTPSWRRTWRRSEMTDFTGGWEAVWTFQCAVLCHGWWWCLKKQNCVLQIVLLVKINK